MFPIHKCEEILNLGLTRAPIIYYCLFLMKLYLFFMFTIFIFLCTHLFGNFSTYKTSSVFLEKNLIDLPISSWKNPTLNDYMLIQRQLYINVKKAIEVPISEGGFFSDPRWTADYGGVVFRMGRLGLIDERNPFATDPNFEFIHFIEIAKVKEN